MFVPKFPFLERDLTKSYNDSFELRSTHHKYSRNMFKLQLNLTTTFVRINNRNIPHRGPMMDALHRLHQVPQMAHTQGQWISLLLKRLNLSTRTNQVQQVRSENLSVTQKWTHFATITYISTVDPQDIGHLPAPTSITDIPETLKELQQLRLKTLNQPQQSNPMQVLKNSTNQKTNKRCGKHSITALHQDANLDCTQEPYPTYCICFSYVFILFKSFFCIIWFLFWGTWYTSTGASRASKYPVCSVKVQRATW